jgi:hypothetical protein
MPADATHYRLTWDEWRTQQRQDPQQEPLSSSAPLPRRREVAARAFMAWFDATANGRHDAPFDDREQAVRRYMRAFADVAAMLDLCSGAELA